MILIRFILYFIILNTISNAATLKIQVISKDYKPMQYITVRLTNFKNQSIVYIKNTDKNGKVLFRDILPDGLYIYECIGLGDLRLSGTIDINGTISRIFKFDINTSNNKNPEGYTLNKKQQIKAKKKPVIFSELKSSSPLNESKKMPDNTDHTPAKATTTIYGRIINRDNGSPIIGARIIIDGRIVYSNEIGKYKINGIRYGHRVIEIYLNENLIYTDFINIRHPTQVYDILINNN